MARARTPDGKRVVIPVRVSEPKADAIDEARGETPRSVWVEAAIDAALERLSAPEPSPPPRTARRGPESASDIAAAIRRRRNGE